MDKEIITEMLTAYTEDVLMPTMAKFVTDYVKSIYETLKIFEEADFDKETKIALFDKIQIELDKKLKEVLENGKEN